MKSDLRNALLIGVIGSASCDGETARMAFRVGEEIARNGGILICGGLGGVMEEAARGAFTAGGITMGFLPGEDPRDANPHITIAIPTGLGHARNVLIARASHGLIAIAGGYGTLSEIGLALKMGKPVIGLKSWNLPGHLNAMETAENTVREIFKRCRKTLTP